MRSFEVSDLQLEYRRKFSWLASVGRGYGGLPKGEREQYKMEWLLYELSQQGCNRVICTARKAVSISSSVCTQGGFFNASLFALTM